MLNVHIVDTGRGILKEDISRLFELFGKLLRTAEMNSEGIGMGLMICKNLVEKSGGEISVQSRGED
jgi:signal transduction histidine kinase